MNTNTEDQIDRANFTFNTPPLVIDVLLRVLSFCDLASICTFSEVNHEFFALARRKEVWIKLISDFQWEGFIDLEPETNLEDLSVVELMKLAKRCVLGPETWMTSSGTSPEVARRIVLKWPSVDPSIWWTNHPFLLPGGRFIFLSRYNGLDCQDVVQNKIIWKYNCRWPLGRVTGYSAALPSAHNFGIDGGAILVVGVRTFERDFSARTNYIEILHLKLDEGISTSLHVMPAPDTDRDDPFNPIHLNDEFALLNLGESYDMGNFMVIHVLTGKCSFLTSRSQVFHFDMSLIPRHLVASSKNLERGFLELRIWDLQSLLNITTDDASSDCLPVVDDIPPVFSQAIEYSGLNIKEVLSFRISTHPSPIFSNSSRLWIIVSTLRSVNGVYRISDKILYCKCLISHPTHGPISVNPSSQWKEVVGQETNFPDYDSDGGFSYSGTMAAYHRHKQYLQTFSNDGFRRKVLQISEMRGDYPFLSAFSGAIAYDAGGPVVIEYYR